VRRDDLSRSEREVGAIYPILKTPSGEIIDGKHRSLIPGWKTETIDVKEPLQVLKIRVHANMLRREIGQREKEGWVTEAFRLLTKKLGRRPLVSEVAEQLGLAEGTVEKYNVDRDRQEHQPQTNVSYHYPCKSCGSTQKKCFSFCDCENCQDRNKRHHRRDLAPAIQYERLPVFDVKLLSNLTVSIPADVVRRLGWQAGDVLSLTAGPRSVMVTKKRVDLKANTP
jgi:hypothetical protein